MIKKFQIQGPLLIESKIFTDERGFFTERFQVERFRNLGINDDFIQDNFSRSKAGVLRGLHLQHTPAQAKLVTCLRGEIQDIIVDLRKDSPTLGKYLEVQLNGEVPQWFYVPDGFAHGFCVLSSDGADVLYKVNSHYNSKGEIGILWNDQDLNLPWKLRDPILSIKDTQNLSFKEVSKSAVVF